MKKTTSKNLKNKHYIHHTFRHRTEHYIYLEHDSTRENNATVNKVITRFKSDKLISSNVSDGLKLDPQEHHDSS